MPRSLRALAGVLGFASCLPMLAMLPAGVVAALAAVGIRASSGPFAALARDLAPVAKPLLVAATLLLVLAGLRCGLGPAILGGLGGSLLYLGMYVLASPAGVGPDGGMAGMGAMTSPTGQSAAVNAPVFYLGLALFVGAYGWPVIRHRRRSCRPLLHSWASPSGRAR